MLEEEPGFVNGNQRRAAIEGAFHAAEEIEQHGDDRRFTIRAAQERLHLADDETRSRQAVIAGVRRSAQCAINHVGLQSGLELFILEVGFEFGQRPPFARGRSELLKRAVNCVPFGRADLDLLHSQNGFDPLLSPPELRLIVDVAERLKGQPAFADVIEAPARGLAQRIQGVPLFKSENLGIWIAEPLRTKSTRLTDLPAQSDRSKAYARHRRSWRLSRYGTRPASPHRAAAANERHQRPMGSSFPCPDR